MMVHHSGTVHLVPTIRSPTIAMWQCAPVSQAIIVQLTIRLLMLALVRNHIMVLVLVLFTGRQSLAAGVS